MLCDAVQLLLCMHIYSAVTNRCWLFVSLVGEILKCKNSYALNILNMSNLYCIASDIQCPAFGSTLYIIQSNTGANFVLSSWNEPHAFICPPKGIRMGWNSVYSAVTNRCWFFAMKWWECQIHSLVTGNLEDLVFESWKTLTRSSVVGRDYCPLYL